MDSHAFTTRSLHHLVDRIRQGDAQAQNELLQRVSHRLERLARKMLHSFPGVQRWEQTDDVLQNALVRLLRALQAVRPENTRAFFGLATEQVRRELLDLNRHYQGAWGLGRNQARRTVGTGDESAAPAHDPMDPQAGPAYVAELERWQALHEAVASLPVAEREVFGMTFYQGWTQLQIAELLQVSERTVRRHWQSACLQLHDMLGGELPQT